MRILRTRKSKIFIIILLLIALFVLWLLWPGFSIDDSDLMPKFINVPDEENGFLHVNFKTSDIYYSPDPLRQETYRKITEGTTWDKNVAQEMVDKNKSLFEGLSKALKCKSFQMPKRVNMNTLLPYLYPWREIARIGKIKVQLLLDEGEKEEALECAAIIIRFGRSIVKSANCYTSFRIGKTILEIGDKSLIELINDEAITSKDIKPYIEELSNLEITPDLEEEILKREYFCYANTFDGISKGSLSFEEIWGISTLQGNLEMRVFFRLKATKRLFAEMFHIAVKNVYKPYSKRESLQPLIEKWSGAKKFTANYLGEGFAADIATSILRMEKEFHFSRFLCRALPVMAALKCYILDHGDLPESLEQLVPDYIKTIPLDPFDEKQIRYSSEKKMLYSVGADLIDSGGANEDEMKKYKNWQSRFLRAADPTIIIEF